MSYPKFFKLMLCVLVLSAFSMTAQAQPARICLLLGMLGAPDPCPANGMDDEPRNSARGGEISFQTVNDITQEADGIFPPISQSSSSLIRTENGVSASLSTSGLVPDATHTMWWLVFNNPEACTGGEQGTELQCLPPGDIGNPEVNASVFGGAGQVSDIYGRATFSAHAFLGEENGLTLLRGPGIVDPFKAEIHLIVQDHGPAGPLEDAGLLEEALRYPGVGCRAFDTDEDGEADEFEPNFGLCLGDIQGVAHVP